MGYSLVTLLTGGSSRAAAAGLALLASQLGEEAVGTAVAAWPCVARQAVALPRGEVASGAAHRAAVAQISCKERETEAWNHRPAEWLGVEGALKPISF